MRTAYRWNHALPAALWISAALLLAGCGASEPAPGPIQPDHLVSALQEKEDLQMRLAIMEQRLFNLEQGQGAAGRAQNPAQAPTLTPLSPAAQGTSQNHMVQVPLVPNAQAQTSAQAATQAPSQPAARAAAPATPRRAASPAPAVPQDYQKALSLLLDQNKPEASRTAFSVFLTDNPDSPFTPNALYWVGETYYSEKKYADAILLFKDVAARFPRHDKAPDALYKALLSYRHLNDTENADYLKKLLLEDYPDSRVAGLLK